MTTELAMPPQVYGADEIELLLHRALDPADPGVGLVGWRGRRLRQPLASGDILLRVSPSGAMRAMAIEDPALVTLGDARRLGLMTEGPHPGRYVRVAHLDGEPAGAICRRITGPDGMILPNSIVLRPFAEGEALEADLEATGRPVLRRGSSGPAVGDLQARLNRIHAARVASGQAGLARCPLALDGIFGSNTAGAVIAFQRVAFPAAPREWDGVVGDHTWGALEAADPGERSAGAAVVDFVRDEDGDHQVDGRAPVATALAPGLWDAAYDATGNVRNNESETDNFVGRDVRRFYIRVSDPAATAPRINASWKTLDAGRADLDAPASQLITLTQTAPGSHVYVSKALMLVCDALDCRQATHSGLPAGVPDAGLRRRGESNFRLRRCAIDGFVRAEYGTVSVELPVFARRPDVRRKINIKVINYGGHATAAQIAAQFAQAGPRWLQTGLRIAGAAAVNRPIPAGVLNAAGAYPGARDNAAEVAALADLIPACRDNTLTVVFVHLDNGANAYTTVLERRLSALGDRFFIFIEPDLNAENLTLAHELHHALFNRPDFPGDATDIDRRRFFPLNTEPPDAYGVALPDVRIERRVQNEHSPDPDNDPPNDNTVNWVRRRRTARMPIANAGDAPGATTGNTLTEPF